MGYSVILLNYKNSEETIRRIKSINKYLSLDYLVVVDNGSPVMKFQIIKDYIDAIAGPKIRLIRNIENLGYARGNNIGLKFLNNEIGYRGVVIVMNPDVQISENSIDELVASFHEFPRSFISPQMKNSKSWWDFTTYNKTLFHEFMRLKHREEDTTDYGNLSNVSIRKVDVLSGALLAAKMSTWEEVNYFDGNTFLYGEEEILQYKAHQQGIESYVLLDIFYEHVGGGSTVDGGSSVKSDFLASKRTQTSRKYYFSEYLNVGRIKWAVLSVVWFLYTIMSVIKRSINRRRNNR